MKAVTTQCNLIISSRTNSYTAGQYENIDHKWLLINCSDTTYPGGKLILINKCIYDESCPDFSTADIDIPKIYPKDAIEISININTINSTGNFMFIWRLQDLNGNAITRLPLYIHTKFDCNRFIPTKLIRPSESEFDYTITQIPFSSSLAQSKQHEFVKKISLTVEHKIALKAKNSDKLSDEKRNRLMEKFEDTIDTYLDELNLKSEPEPKQDTSNNNNAVITEIINCLDKIADTIKQTSDRLKQML